MYLGNNPAGLSPGKSPSRPGLPDGRIILGSDGRFTASNGLLNLVCGFAANPAGRGRSGGFTLVGCWGCESGGGLVLPDIPDVLGLPDAWRLSAIALRNCSSSLKASDT